MLLERYGVVSREVALSEEIPGGFAALYPVLREMEESGRVRRGYFVEGLAGRQFAMPGAVDRLRAAREERESETETVVLSAVDPANPWGALLNWPDRTRPEGPRARRVSGAWVILVRGEPMLFLDSSGKTLVTYRQFLERVDEGSAAKALAGLLTLVRQGRRRSLLIEKINGLPAKEFPRSDLFLEAGFESEYRGFVWALNSKARSAKPWT